MEKDFGRDFMNQEYDIRLILSGFHKGLPPRFLLYKNYPLNGSSMGKYSTLTAKVKRKCLTYSNINAILVTVSKTIMEE